MSLSFPHSVLPRYVSPCSFSLGKHSSLEIPLIQVRSTQITLQGNGRNVVKDTELHMESFTDKQST